MSCPRAADARLVERGASNPQFGASNDRLFMTVRPRTTSCSWSAPTCRRSAPGPCVGRPHQRLPGRARRPLGRLPPELRSLLMPLLPGAQDVTGGDREGRASRRPAEPGRRRLHPLLRRQPRVHWSIGPTLLQRRHRRPSTRRLQGPTTAASACRGRSPPPSRAAAWRWTGARIVTMRGPTAA
jgi:hypothetical protein